MTHFRTMYFPDGGVPKVETTQKDENQGTEKQTQVPASAATAMATAPSTLAVTTEEPEARLSMSNATSFPGEIVGAFQQGNNISPSIVPAKGVVLACVLVVTQFHLLI